VDAQGAAARPDVGLATTMSQEAGTVRARNRNGRRQEAGQMAL
jgi:hypothetical protein